MHPCWKKTQKKNTWIAVYTDIAGLTDCLPLFLSLRWSTSRTVLMERLLITLPGVTNGSVSGSMFGYPFQGSPGRNSAKQTRHSVIYATMAQRHARPSELLCNILFQCKIWLEQVKSIYEANGTEPGGQLPLVEPWGDLARLGQPSPTEPGGLMGALLALMKSYGPKGESSSLRPDVIAPIVKSYPSDIFAHFQDCTWIFFLLR